MGRHLGGNNRRFLEGQAGWVTARAGRVGREIASALANAGASVAVGLIGREDVGRSGANPGSPGSSGLDGMLDAVAVAGSRGVGGVFDMSSGEALQRFVANLERELGPISILVHILKPPGSAHDAADLEKELEDWLRVIEAMRPSMMELGRGRIITVIDATDLGDTDQEWQELAQTRLESLTRGVALNVGASGVACFLVGRGAPQDPARIATLVAALCADEALPLSGQTVTLVSA